MRLPEQLSRYDTPYSRRTAKRVAHKAWRKIAKAWIRAGEIVTPRSRREKFCGWSF